MNNKIFYKFKSFTKSTLRTVYLNKYIRDINKINLIDSSNSKKIINCITSSLKNEINKEEYEIIHKIEELRIKLLSNHSEIEIEDFGAGSPDSSRTELEMKKGIYLKKKISDICLQASKPYFWCLILFKLIREFKSQNALELGTCLGVSTAYQASAQKINTNGNITSIEGANSLAILSKNNLEELNLNNCQVVNGRFIDKLDEILDVSNIIDYAFIDGHHDKNATISYFELLLPYLAKHSILVFDDINWSDGMKQAWQYIINNQNIKISINLKQLGICILDDNLTTKHDFIIPIY